MIYICADDYGLCASASMRIQDCIENGALDKVSVFVNIDKVDLNKIIENKKIRLSLHLNLVEGKCMADASEVGLIADENGYLKHDFGGLFKLWLTRRKEVEEQVYKEIKAQISFWQKNLPEGIPFCIDSHQHTHMIPAVFKALVRVLKEKEIVLKHMRIPAEPLLPYIKTPSLYLTYKPINIIKQWLLKFLWAINKKETKKYKIPTSHFMGILFSGKMDEKRVRKILPKYMKMAEKSGRDIEVLFHPGYIDEQKTDVKSNNIVFKEFYLSENRKTEYDSVMKISERSVK